MKKFNYISGIIAFLLLILNGCINQTIEEKDDVLFEGFISPPSEARPFVRWWWNGNHLSEAEIIRELNTLKSAGFGGVEINPIEMPEEAVDIGTEAIQWLSEDWINYLKLAAQEAKKRGMITDLIVGSGWPFGGEFLSNEETIQRVITNKIPCKENKKLNENIESLYEKALQAMSRKENEKAKSYEIFFVRLVPKSVHKTSEIIDLTEKFKENNKLDFTVPEGEYDLVYGILQHSHREVMHGALGAAGPVMDHYKKEVTIAYLNRLKKISEVTGIPLSELIRALFCDSIELAGANWTDGLSELFYQTYNYSLVPYFPFIFYDPYIGYSDDDLPKNMTDEIKRARYDYNNFLVKLFLKNFTQQFQDFCTENGVLCRYQAYGTPFLMGMMEGNMIADIPESNNWIYSAEMNTDEWQWNQNHGYMIWNLYAASGGHLTGRKIISSEAMTNTRGVFKTSLDEIKRNDDMNFITGINHSILHGFNYSPPEAGFPGWIRYGAYFNEQNPWWPYINKWTDYNARLSYVFQQSKPIKNIGILAPQSDIWTDKGLVRPPFHTQPWYCYQLWEPISQAGSSCDYISESIIREGNKENGILEYGPMSFQTIILCGIQSIEQETAIALRQFVENGGKIVLVDKIPERSVSMTDAAKNDSIVKSTFQTIFSDHTDRVLKIESPASEDELLSWTSGLLDKIKIEKDVIIQNPDKNIFQIHEQYKNKDIYFFVNSNRKKTISINTHFPTQKKTPWIWNPEEGIRSVYPYADTPNEFQIKLKPLQSILIVFEPTLKGETTKPEDYNESTTTIETNWDAKFTHMNGETFERKFKNLVEFGTSDDEELNTFSGTVIYSADFMSDGQGDWIKLESVNKGVTEVILNGQNLGINWYGEPQFPINGNLKEGKNQIEIKYTTVLSNYAMSLKDNPTAKKWTNGFEKIPIGLAGKVSVVGNK